MAKKTILLAFAIGFLIIFSAIVYVVIRDNTKVCQEYWNETCSSYRIATETCVCEGGEYVTTQDMITKRNRELYNFSQMRVWNYTLDPEIANFSFNFN